MPGFTGEVASAGSRTSGQAHSASCRIHASHPPLARRSPASAWQRRRRRAQAVCVPCTWRRSACRSHRASRGRLHQSGNGKGRGGGGTVAQRTRAHCLCAAVPGSAPRTSSPHRCSTEPARFGWYAAEPRSLGVDPGRLGVWGFSAGGHLAGYLATINDAGNATSSDPIERQSDRPDFAILSYARLTMDNNVPRKGNMEGLLGTSPTQAQIDAISPVLHVTRATSPSFYLRHHSGRTGQLAECHDVLRRHAASGSPCRDARLPAWTARNRHGSEPQRVAGTGGVADLAGELDARSSIDGRRVGSSNNPLAQINRPSSRREYSWKAHAR